MPKTSRISQHGHKLAEQITRYTKVIYRVASAMLFLLLIVGVVAYGRGYRLDFQQKSLTSTGIIAVNSYPNAARVYVTDQKGDTEFKGATSINITLPPGVYKIDVEKDGYTSFAQTITLKGELVQSVDALLFPKNPSLTPLTNLGVVKAQQVGQSDRIILFSQTGDPKKDGIYTFEAGQSPFSFLPPLNTVILKNALPLGDLIDFENADIYFSHDFKQGIFEFILEDGTAVRYLLNLTNSNQEVFDVTSTYANLLAAWEEEKRQDTKKILEAFPRELRPIASDSFAIRSVSPDETKVLYEAQDNVTLPLVINPPLVAVNQTPQNRTLKTGELYVYDKKEDRNYHIVSSKSKTQSSNQAQDSNSDVLDSKFLHLNSILWFPDSRHLLLPRDENISVMVYDGTNTQTVYSGPFERDFVGLDSSGKLLVLINLNPQSNKLPDLYSVGIR